MQHKKKENDGKNGSEKLVSFGQPKEHIANVAEITE